MESFGKMMKPLRLALALVLILLASTAFALDDDPNPVVGNNNEELLLVGYTDDNCSRLGDPCDGINHCCADLYCDQGRCNCRTQGQTCELKYPCCEGLACSSTGICAPKVILNNKKSHLELVELLLVGYTEYRCVRYGEPCNKFIHCCEHLYCNDPFEGTCTCGDQGESCALKYPCCEGLACTNAFNGICIPIKRSASPWEEFGSRACALKQD